MTAAFPADSSRVFRFTMIGMLIFALLQVCWWLIDQTSYAEITTAQVQRLYASDMAAARRLESLGVSVPEIAGLFPHIAVDQTGKLVVRPDAAQYLESTRHSHVNQYSWESGFFLVVLACCISVLWRGLREEREIRRQQDNFLALVSHQFKTPLAGLRLSAETLIKRNPPPDYARKLSQRMIDDVVRLEDMVTKILDSARLERGRVQFQKTQVDLNGAAQQIITRLEDTARSHGVILESAIPTGLTITADPLAVDTVLRNLLENAIAASGNQGGNQGGSQGGDQTGRVTLSARSLPDDDEVEVTVVDTGVGFPQADARRLFEKFHRYDAGDRQANGGTGLGLFIVARIMHFAGGRAEAVSAGPGKGAAFSVTWPAGPAS